MRYYSEVQAKVKNNRCLIFELETEAHSKENTIFFFLFMLFLTYLLLIFCKWVTNELQRYWTVKVRCTVSCSFMIAFSKTSLGSN